MSDDASKAADALVDVRKAYRLLYYYQKRVMDLGEAVANQFNYQFFYWRSDHGAVSQANSDPKLRSMWDMLPASAINFLYLPIGKGRDPRKEGELMLSVRVIADSALHEAKSKSEPKAFAPPEECNSYVDFYAWHSTRADDRDWFYGVWQAVKFPQTDETPVTHSDFGIVNLGRRHQLLDLFTEEAIEEESESFMTLVISKLELEEDFFSKVGVE